MEILYSVYNCKHLFETNLFQVTTSEHLGHFKIHSQFPALFLHFYFYRDLMWVRLLMRYGVYGYCSQEIRENSRALFCAMVVLSRANEQTLLNCMAKRTKIKVLSWKVPIGDWFNQHGATLGHFECDL